MHQSKGVIAAGDRLTAEAGAEVLRAGGNAFDACIAATFMSFAASSSITSAGGGGFMLAAKPGKNPVLYDFFVQTPRRKLAASEIEFYPVTVDFGDKTQEFHVGLGAAAVPGNIAGLFKVHDELGKMPMAELMTPVLEGIKKGIKIHEQTHYQIKILTPILTASTAGQQIYQPDHEALAQGESYYLPKMMDTFEYLSRSGPDEFYKGEIAQSVDSLCRRHGGHLSLEDFNNYHVVKRKPLTLTYRRANIYTNPPPNAGGPLIAFMLHLLEKVPLLHNDFGKAKHLQALTEAMRLTTLSRDKTLQKETMTSGLFSAEHLTTMTTAMRQAMHKSGNTTHVSVADKHGNIASCTTSVGEGCGHFIPGTDIMINNMLGEEDLNKGGFHRWREDTRMSSMMSPTLVIRADGSMAGMGSGGSNRIRSAISQAIVNYVDFHLPYDQVVNHPRVHLENEHLDIEPGYPRQEIDRLVLPQGVEKFYWNKQNMYFGGVHAVFLDEKGNLTAAGDRRRVGYTIKA